jgi:hypothetical protein
MPLYKHGIGKKEKKRKTRRHVLIHCIDQGQGVSLNV